MNDNLREAAGSSEILAAASTIEAAHERPLMAAIVSRFAGGERDQLLDAVMVEDRAT